ncbi:hypothetical protein GCM10011494_09980 [Novosphingobium endophyticum]|uniref:Uncharacterized protein n=1 Tax=Novosphingobium endophyticum TaxID=1955250 RepID=A0A916TT29_9SPHN|nr:hypothetical protein [Novosphingobium endophyticum]GGB93573.1 hypothetical protein GCM10011494_09980 [Novosphingobium endophyticum]
MSARAGGWQTALADLSLILFMVTAAAVGQQLPATRESREMDPGHAVSAPPLQAEPLAVYVDAPGAPPLADWLDQQAVDPRQQLTVTARYGPAPGAQERALATAVRLVREAGRAGHAARIVIEPGEGPSRVVIAFDSSGEVAQGLLATR